jgi:hypothetical protein
MLENGYKYNKNRSTIRLPDGADETVVILRPRNAPYLWGVAALLGGLLLSLFAYALLSVSEPAGNQPSGLSSAAPNGGSTELVRDVELLKGQMSVLITGAMESKIRRLEGSLQSGMISATDLTTLRELKEDLKVLKTYSLQNAATTFGLFEGAGKITGPVHAGAALYPDELLHEISNIKNFFYISIASWGIAIVLFAGAWLTGFYRFRQLQSERLFRQQMLGKPKTGYF